jgi:hypothetical protein
MRVRSRGRPRYLIEKRKVSADCAIGLIVVVKAQNVFRHSLRVRARTDFAFFLIREPDEYVGMLTGLIFYRLVEGRQKRRAAPVVDDSIAFRDVIEMRTNQDDLAGTAR